jgi:hypothetical protein
MHKYMETTNVSNYDGSCTLHRFRSGTTEISSSLIFVGLSVPYRLWHCLKYRKPWTYPWLITWNSVQWKCISEEALNGIKIMYGVTNTNSCFLKRTWLFSRRVYSMHQPVLPPPPPSPRSDRATRSHSCRTSTILLYTYFLFTFWHFPSSTGQISLARGSKRHYMALNWQTADATLTWTYGSYCLHSQQRPLDNSKIFACFASWIGGFTHRCDI